MMKNRNSYFLWSVLLGAGFLLAACGTVKDGPTSDNSHNLGYLKVNKTESTNSVGQWMRDYRSDNPNLTLADMLLRVPGVQVHGQGNDAFITIRGINSFYAENEPLFVVDGMSIGFGYNSVSFLNPMDIDNISVLKDSAASLYGIRGSNGVIIIETKKPERRDKRRD